LAAGLARAGHEVTLAVTDITLRDHSVAARELGFCLLPVAGQQLPSIDMLGQVRRELLAAHDPVKQFGLILKHWFDPVALALFEAAQSLCRSSDLVVGHMLIDALRVAAQQAHIPLATVAPAPTGIPSALLRPHGVPNLGRWANPWWWKLARVMTNRAFLPKVNALRRQQGLAPDCDVLTQTWSSQWLNLVAVSPALFERPADWGAQHRVCGFLNPPAQQRLEEVAPGLQEFLAAGEPPVYFTYGSLMPWHLPLLREEAHIWLAAVRRVGCRAIFQLPWDDLGAFEQDPRVFHVQRSPHRLIFPKCAMVVHHGGAGTTQTALRAGRPAVVVAHLVDQFFWGAQLERLGVAGRSLQRRGLLAAGLAKSIIEVRQSPAMARRAALLGRTMSAEDGVQVAVQTIEASIARR
jgi:UDP:flavonoid glycosyltransferase YjiC (YdhE family)